MSAADERLNPGAVASTSGSVDKKLEKISIPDTVDLESFVTARKNELTALTEKVKVKMRKLVSQQLPRHMRRRAVSHNKKRLPRRLQNRSNAESAKTTKRPSRKHRRRPKNLQAEYERRESKVRWLETHIWHAKRFRMATEHGWKIPLTSFDKGYRANYRASSKFCMLNDISYEALFEIRGRQSTICQNLATFSDPKANLSIGAKKYVDGKFRGRIWLYTPELFPYSPLGPIEFLWRAETEKNESEKTDTENTDSDDAETIDPTRVIWIWCDQVLRVRLWHALVKAFNVNGKVEEPGFFKSDTGWIKDLTGCISRFRLTGPLSARVLCEALTQDTTEYQDSDYMFSPAYYNKFWNVIKKNALGCFGSIQNGLVAGNLILDPRLHMPKKRMVTTVIGAEDDEKRNTPITFDEVPVGSDIWNSLIRNLVKDDQLPQVDLDRLRQDNLVPGTPLELGPEETRIPILTIFRTGQTEPLGYGRGIDLLVPNGWGKQVFLALVYRSARVAGRDDLKRMNRNAGCFVYPDDVPDSPQAQAWLKAETEALRTKHFKYPPNKRPSFLKLSMNQPYAMPFDHLVSSHYPRHADYVEASQINQPFYVIRDEYFLRRLDLARKARNISLKTLSEAYGLRQYQNALIPVKVVCTSRGVPRRFARLYFHPKDGFEGAHEETSCSAVSEKHRTKVEFDESVVSAQSDNMFPICGFVCAGDENLTMERCSALGYISLMSLIKRFGEGHFKFGFRNQNEQCYHVVDLQIIYQV